MVILIILALLSFAGIGTALWLLKKEQETDQDSSFRDQAEQLSLMKDFSEHPQEEHQKPSPGEKPTESMDNPPKQKLSLNFFKNILEKLKFGKKTPETNEVPETAPLPNLLKEHFETTNNTVFPDEVQTGTASIKTVPAEVPVEKNTLSKEKEKNIEAEINLSAQRDELKEKYEKLDVMFNEKSAELKKTKEALENELKNRKEFNKIKDLLEKEIKDSKDKARNIQVEFNNTQTEAEGHKKRIAQLETKATSLEKDILEKEEKIDELLKRLQTFASPSTAATPPVTDKTKEGEKTTPPQEKPTTIKKPEVESPRNPDESQKKEDSTNEQPPTGTEINKSREETPNEEAQPTTEPAPSQDIEKSSQDNVKKNNEGDEEKGTPETTEPTATNESESEPSMDEPSETIERIGFLKLQPDILQEPKKNKSFADEIDQSLEMPQPPSSDTNSKKKESDDPENPEDNNNENKNKKE